MTTYRNCLSCTSEIFNIYEQYAEIDHGNVNSMINNNAEDIRSALEREDYYLANLTIDLPLEQIKEVFEKYHVIQLRPIEDSSDLLIGCGNRPVNPHYQNGGHDHLGMVTINPKLSMNPTIVAAFGYDDGLNHILPRHHFENLHAEATTISDHISIFMQSKVAREAMECLKPDFKTFEVGYKDPFPSFGNSNFFLKYENE